MAYKAKLTVNSVVVFGSDHPTVVLRSNGRFQPPDDDRPNGLGEAQACGSAASGQILIEAAVPPPTADTSRILTASQKLP
ncbi:hypothetical protein [Mesorhizobium sp. M0037]|uniref:hypothetical protein n=1 Tax=unclassified Mesorhizobium TaxID=325217 RepID=UPI003334DFAA